MEQTAQAQTDIGQSPTMAGGDLQSYEKVAPYEGVENPTGKKWKKFIVLFALPRLFFFREIQLHTVIAE